MKTENIDSLVVSASQDAGGYAISRQNNIKLLYLYVDWVIFHWYACGADGRSVGRSGGVMNGHVITEFSGIGRST